jgi:hypothetical protein
MTDPLHILPDVERSALEDHLSRLRHDLGKYVSLQVRWLGADPEPGDLGRALAADLLETRRGPNGTVDASTVWAELRPGIASALAGDADFVALDDAMRVIDEVSGALRAGASDPGTVRRGVEAAATVTEQCRRLWARVRGG